MSMAESRSVFNVLFYGGNEPVSDTPVSAAGGWMMNSSGMVMEHRYLYSYSKSRQ